MSKITVLFFSGPSSREMTAVLEEGDTYYDLLRELGINPETVLVIRDGLPVPMDDTPFPGDVRIYRVVSSG